ncbi:MAG: hypothetical protein QF749_08390 [Verrucomicrobiota bacterium]|jgi:hypothetical protein|nr:hypothetical protein [Verrucomicrobiota bacterium]MDP6252876.1 hypothetical protein [Verrucomicrobiota bacterium]MDP7178297.1 hypothetical protein [Verrucomicrobiota bacterium]MDP7293087.1 hypothetical protein [Verrucomicrobiota bacterium]MDP7442510.1 hypothetical protein [Verrucomicrobiota bacterium]|tara:strand:+ start:97 stop:501 length:405 start_codon:yes stop_codon:yes gene_type:complete
MRARFKDTPRERRKFLVSLSIMLSVVVAVLLWRAIIPWPSAWLAWGTVAVMLCVGLAWEAAGRCVHRAGMMLGFCMGRVFGTLFLLLLFFVVLLPLGLTLRLFGKDLLQMRKWPPVAESYWKIPRPPGSLDRMH